MSEDMNQEKLILELKRELKRNKQALNFFRKRYQAVLDSFNNLDFLEEFSVALGNTPDVDKMSRLFLAEIKKFIEPEICALFLTRQETHEFVLQEVVPYDYKALCQEEIKYQIEAGVFAWVINHKKPAVLPPLYFTKKDLGNNVLILCPLWTTRNVLGMLLVITSIDGPFLTQHILNIVSIICRHFSITLETLMLCQELKSQNHILELTKRQLEESQQQIRNYNKLLEHRIAERTKELRESEKRYRHLFDSLKDGIFQLDAQGNLISANPAWIEMLGYNSFAEAKEVPMRDLFLSPEERNKLCQMLRQQGYAQNYVASMRRKDGQPKIVEITCNYTGDSNGKTQGLEGIMRDITERKSLEEYLIQSEKLKALGEMASGVAHDFNNILGVILGRVQILLKLTQDEKLRKNILLLEKVALDGAQIIKRIQDFTRKRSQKEFVPVNIHEIIEDVLAITKTRWKDEADAANRKIILESNFGSIVPINGDPSQLREVFTNIFLNALDALPQGGHIYINTGMEDKWVYIAIRDTGIGMSEETKKRVFDPFFTTKGAKGNGLGMSIAYKIIDSHNGRIMIDSETGKGTQVKVLLPIISDDNQRIQRKRSEQISVIPADHNNGKKALILIIDDDDDLRLTLSDILGSEGHRIIASGKAQEGIEIFRKTSPDLVITDLGMPDITGWEVAKTIKKINPQASVILITGWDVPSQKNALQRKGVDALLRKPFQSHQLIELVDQIILAHSSHLDNTS
jgi:PAS domain S-box-containing protein